MIYHRMTVKSALEVPIIEEFMRRGVDLDGVHTIDMQLTP